MRIAMVTPGFSADDDDWCIPVLQNLACRLAEVHDVRVYTCSYPHHSSRYQVKGVPVRSFGDARSGRLAGLARLRRALHAIEQDHRERPFDVVHGFWADSGGLVAALAGQRLRIRSVLTVMGGELIHEPRADYGKRRRPIAGNLARLGAHLATVVNVGSAYHRDRILTEQSRLDPVVITLGIDTRLFSDTAAPRQLEGAPAVLCVGSLVAVKGHKLIFDALARASAQCPELQLHVVGQGLLESELRRVVANLGLASRVTFHGHIEHQKLPAWYRGADFCILGSLFENLGMTILEAAACGRLTVGSAVGLMPDLCPARLLAAPGDSAALAQVLRLAATDRTPRQTLASRLPQIVGTEYRLECTVGAFESLYHDRLP
jgi:glycosyltransferase involved in cell wall biosynthesis